MTLISSERSRTPPLRFPFIYKFLIHVICRQIMIHIFLVLNASLICLKRMPVPIPKGRHFFRKRLAPFGRQPITFLPIGYRLYFLSFRLYFTGREPIITGYLPLSEKNKRGSPSRKTINFKSLQ